MYTADRNVVCLFVLLGGGLSVSLFGKLVQIFTTKLSLQRLLGFPNLLISKQTPFYEQKEPRCSKFLDFEPRNLTQPKPCVLFMEYLNLQRMLTLLLIGMLLTQMWCRSEL